MTKNNFIKSLAAVFAVVILAGLFSEPVPASDIRTGSAISSPSAVVTEPAITPSEPSEPQEPAEPTEPEEPSEPADEPVKSPYKAGKKFAYRGLKYQIISPSKRTVRVYGIQSKSSTIVIIPGTVVYRDRRFSVTEIDNGAFKNCPVLKKAIIGVNIKKIGKSAFEGDSRLKYITVWTEKLSSVGKNALKGTYKNLKINVYKKNFIKYQKLFKNKGLNTVKVISQ